MDLELREGVGVGAGVGCLTFLPKDGESRRVRFLLLGNNNCCRCQAPEWKEDLCEIWAASRETV